MFNDGILCWQIVTASLCWQIVTASLCWQIVTASLCWQIVTASLCWQIVDVLHLFLALLRRVIPLPHLQVTTFKVLMMHNTTVLFLTFVYLPCWYFRSDAYVKFVFRLFRCLDIFLCSLSWYFWIVVLLWNKEFCLWSSRLNAFLRITSTEQWG